jgi:hypothetical protein
MRLRQAARPLAPDLDFKFNQSFHWSLEPHSVETRESLSANVLVLGIGVRLNHLPRLRPAPDQMRLRVPIRRRAPHVGCQSPIGRHLPGVAAGAPRRCGVPAVPNVRARTRGGQFERGLGKARSSRVCDQVEESSERLARQLCPALGPESRHISGECWTGGFMCC